jgi:hypothetical protein
MCGHVVQSRHVNSTRALSIVVLALMLLALNACIPGPGGSVINGPTRTAVSATIRATKPRPTFTPAPTVAKAQPLTFKKAFTFLIQQSGVADLAFFAYDASNVDAQGQSANYTITGYSPTQRRTCYHYTGANGELTLSCRDQESIAGPTVADLDTLKDSPDLVAEAFAKYEPCTTGLHLNINLSQSEAQMVCSAKWSGEVSPFK